MLFNDTSAQFRPLSVLSNILPVYVYIYIYIYIYPLQIYNIIKNNSQYARKSLKLPAGILVVLIYERGSRATNLCAHAVSVVYNYHL